MNPISTSGNSWLQRNWRWLIPTGGCLGLAILMAVVCFLLPFLTLFTALTSNEVYQQALQKARTNPEVIQALGEPVERGWFVSGSIHISGPSGRADLAIPISGPKNSGTLYAIAGKRAGRWEFSVLEVAVKGQSGRINLLDEELAMRLEPAPIFTMPPSPTPPPLFGTPTPTRTPLTWVAFRSQDLDLALKYPLEWDVAKTEDLVIFSPSEYGLDPENLYEAAFWIRRSPDKTSPEQLLATSLNQFPEDAEIISEGSMHIASSTWSSAQITFDDQYLGEMVATVAVTTREGQTYTLVAVAPRTEWDAVQPTFQMMINTLQFE